MNNLSKLKKTTDHSSHPRARRLLRLFVVLCAVFIGLYLVGLLLMSTMSLDQLREIRRNLRAFGEWWVVVRLTFIVSLTVYWVEFNTWLARRNDWTHAHLQRVLAGRWVVLATLVCVELIFMQRIHEPLMNGLRQ